MSTMSMEEGGGTICTTAATDAKKSVVDWRQLETRT
jgi:hypothetical protein